MPIVTQVTFRNCAPSAAIERDIQRRADKLARLCTRIVRCAVVVELPHRRHHGGNWFHIRVELTLPGEDVVINHEPKRVEPSRYGDLEGDARLGEPNATGRHSRVAVREAFEAASRRLRQHAQLLRGDVRGDSVARRRVAGPVPA